MAAYDAIATAYILVSVGLLLYLSVVVLKKWRELPKKKGNSN
jgi:hypothetical protein